MRVGRYVINTKEELEDLFGSGSISPETYKKYLAKFDEDGTDYKKLYEEAQLVIAELKRRMRGLGIEV